MEQDHAQTARTRAMIVLLLGLLGMGFSGIFVSLAGAPGPTWS